MRDTPGAKDGREIRIYLFLFLLHGLPRLAVLHRNPFIATVYSTWIACTYISFTLTDRNLVYRTDGWGAKVEKHPPTQKKSNEPC